MGLDTGGQNKHGYGQELRRLDCCSLADVGKQKNPYTIRLHFLGKLLTVMYLTVITE